MKAPERFTITITGTQAGVFAREKISRGIGHYLSELMQGTEIPDDVWEKWGLRVAVEATEE